MTTDVLKDVEEKISKLWKMLEAQNKKIEEILKTQRTFIEAGDVDAVGDLAGQIVVLSQSSVCCAMALEILENLKPKEQIGG